jgi:hypothetical protein
MRIPFRRAVLAALVALALIVVASAAAGTKSTRSAKIGGDPDTLAYFEQVVDDWKSVPGARVTEFGLFWLAYNGGSAVNFRWGSSRPQGYKSAKAVMDYWLENGKIVAYLATVTAHDIPRLRILVAAGKVYLSTTQCWQRSTPASAPFGTGERTLISDANAQFEKMQRVGDHHVVKYHYIWTTGSTATQTDTLGLSSPSTIHSQIVVRGDQRFKISLIARPLGRRPDLPLVNHSPKPPAPAPFCKST